MDTECYCINFRCDSRTYSDNPQAKKPTFCVNCSAPLTVEDYRLVKPLHCPVEHLSQKGNSEIWELILDGKEQDKVLKILKKYDQDFIIDCFRSEHRFLADYSNDIRLSRSQYMKVKRMPIEYFRKRPPILRMVTRFDVRGLSFGK